MSTSLKERDLLIVDLETTGLDPIIHEVLEVAAIRVHQESLEIQSTFTAKVVPQHPFTAEPKALEVNGYTLEAWKDAVWPSDVWPSFFDFAHNTILCSYAAVFEIGFLRETFKSYMKIPADADAREVFRFGPFARHIIDIPSIAWSLLGPVEKLGKDPVAEILGLRPEEEPHRALNGATHALAVLRAIKFHIGRQHGKAA
jgi:DNA polymerase-3 subunit epsilon